jgi:hypothetical protein
VEVEDRPVRMREAPAVSGELELSGYHVFDGRDFEEAAQIASRISSARLAGRAEARPEVERLTLLEDVFRAE